MKKLMPYALCIMLCGCAGTEVVDLNNQRAVANLTNVMELEYRDWENTADKMTSSMIASGALGRVKDPVIAIGTITNDTMQRFDTDILIKKIRTTLVNSGRAQVTTAMTHNGKTEDSVAKETRDLRNDAEYNQGTIAAKGNMIAANVSMTGKMIQRNLDLHTCWLCRERDRVEYYLQLTLTNVNTGLSIWEDEQPIIKEGKYAPTW